MVYQWTKTFSLGMDSKRENIASNLLVGNAQRSRMASKAYQA
jgi:hypothetical protein